MQAAGEAFSERGFHNVQVADIARVLGIGHGTVYRYFDNKHDVFYALVEAAVEALIEAAHEADTLGDLTERVLESATSHAALLSVHAPGVSAEIDGLLSTLHHALDTRAAACIGCSQRARLWRAAVLEAARAGDKEGWAPLIEQAFSASITPQSTASGPRAPGWK